MLFILGLTFFVSVIAQTRMLEGVTFFLLRRNRRAPILPTVIVGDRRRGLRLGHSRRRLDDRADDPDARDHPDAGGRAAPGDPSSP